LFSFVSNDSLPFENNENTPERRVMFLNECIYNVALATYTGGEAFPPVDDDDLVALNAEYGKAYTAEEVKKVVEDLLHTELRINEIYTQKFREHECIFIELMSNILFQSDTKAAQFIPAYLVLDLETFLNNSYEDIVNTVAERLHSLEAKQAFLKEERKYLAVRNREIGDGTPSAISSGKVYSKNFDTLDPTQARLPSVFFDDNLSKKLSKLALEVNSEQDRAAAEQEAGKRTVPKRGDGGDTGLDLAEEVQHELTFPEILAEWLQTDALGNLKEGHQQNEWSGDLLWYELMRLWKADDLKPGEEPLNEREKAAMTKFAKAGFPKKRLFPVNFMVDFPMEEGGRLIDNAWAVITNPQRARNVPIRYKSLENGIECVKNETVTQSTGGEGDTQVKIKTTYLYHYDVANLFTLEYLISDIRSLLQAHPEELFTPLAMQQRAPPLSLLRSCPSSTLERVLENATLKQLENEKIKKLGPVYRYINSKTETRRREKQDRRDRVRALVERKPKEPVPRPRARAPRVAPAAELEDMETEPPEPLDGDVWKIKPSIILKNWQIQNVVKFQALTSEKRGMILADKPGMGKTGSALAAMCNMSAQKGRGLRALLLVPKNVILQWHAEILTFTEIQQKLIFGASQSKKLETDISYVFICTPQTYLSRLEKFKTVPAYDFIVLDEVHTMRGTTENPTRKMIQALCTATLANGGGVLGLTGTPIGTNFGGLAPLSRFVNVPGENTDAYWKSITVEQMTGELLHNTQRWLVSNPPPEYTRLTTEVDKVGLDSQSRTELVRRVAHSLVLDEATENNETVKKKVEARQNICQLLALASIDFRFVDPDFKPTDQVAADLGDEDGLAVDIVPLSTEKIENIAQQLIRNKTPLVQKLLERCQKLHLNEGIESTYYKEKGDAAGSLVVQTEGEWKKAQAKAKVTAVENITTNRKVIIFSHFVQVLQVMARVFGAEFGAPTPEVYHGKLNAKERDEVLTNFREKTSHPYLFMSTLAGGAGLNLQDASAVVFLDVWWTKATHEQAVARAHRMGQTRDVQVAYVLSDPSISVYILEVLHAKQAAMDVAIRQTARGQLLDQWNIAIEQEDDEEVKKKQSFNAIDWLRNELGIEPPPERQRVTRRAAGAAAGAAAAAAPAASENTIIVISDDEESDDKATGVAQIGAHLAALNLYFKS
jgi:SNF2 family DNA or RNA helicase